MSVRLMTIGKWLLVPGAIAAYITVSGLTGFCPTCKLIVDRVRGVGTPDATSPLPAAPTPVSFAAYNLEGREVSLQPRPDTVTLIDLWGTRCPPCIEQRRILAALASHNQPGEPSIRIVSIATDNNIAEVQAFVAQHPGAGEDLITGPDTLGTLLRAAGIDGNAAGSLALPTILLMDARGQISPPHPGVQSLDALRSAIRSLR